jgi:hypothetical protein
MVFELEPAKDLDARSQCRIEHIDVPRTINLPQYLTCGVLPYVQKRRYAWAYLGGLDTQIATTTGFFAALERHIRSADYGGCGVHQPKGFQREKFSRSNV